MFTIPDTSRSGDPALSQIFEADFRILAAGIGHTGVIDGCAVRSMPREGVVYVEPGEYAVRGERHWCTGGRLSVLPPVGYKRLDLIIVTPRTDGAPWVVMGDPGEHPELPVPPDDGAALAAVLVLPGTHYVYEKHVVDKRVLLPMSPMMEV